MSKIRVSMLPVAQGAMNLIEVYDDESNLINLTLIDCGAEQSRENVCQTSIEYVQDRMKARLDVDRVMFDNVIITHLDKDHWNLLYKLFPSKFVTKHIIVQTVRIGILHMEERVADGRETCETNVINSQFSSMVYTSYLKRYVDGSYKDVKYDKLTGKGRYIVEYYDEEYDIFGMKLEIFIREETYLQITFEDHKSLRFARANAYEDGVYLKNYTQSSEIFSSNYNLNEWESIIGTYTACIESILKDISGKPDVYDRILHMLDGMPELIKKVSDDLQATVPTDKYITNFYAGGDTEQRNKYTSVDEALLFAEVISDFFHADISSINNIKIDIGDSWELDIVERYNVGQIPSVYNGSSITQSSIKKNATSAVSVLYAKADADLFKVFFPGDATVHTFYKLLQYQKIIQDAVWSAPHHGSYVTMKGYVSRKEKIELFPLILEKYQPREIVISAGYKNNYGLPNKLFIKRAGEYIKSRKNISQNHYLIFNNDKPSRIEWKYSLANIPIYTLLNVNNEKTKYCCIYINEDSGEKYYTDFDYYDEIEDVKYQYEPIDDLYIKDEDKDGETAPGQPRPPLEYTIPAPNVIPPRNMLFCRG